MTPDQREHFFELLRERLKATDRDPQTGALWEFLNFHTSAARENREEVSDRYLLLLCDAWKDYDGLRVQAGKTD